MRMNSNSIAPSRKSVDLYLDGSDWKLDLYDVDNNAITNATIGNVTVTSGVVALPLSLRDLGGDASHELRIHGDGTIKIRTSEALSSEFPIAGLTVKNGEVIGQQVEIIESISGCTRIRIAWG